MRSSVIGSLLVSVALVLPLSVKADHNADQRSDRGDERGGNNGWGSGGDSQQCKPSEHHDHQLNTPLKLLGVVTVPGNPIISADIGWVDPASERYFLADRSNSGVDIIDAENDVYVARVPGFAGALTSGGGTTTTNGPGPNGVLVTPNQRLWAGDGNSTAQVADVDPTSSTYLTILKTVSTTNSTCDNGTATGHYCGRADELGYDPKDHLILIANNAPLDPVKLCPTMTNPTAHCSVDPFATFINADTFVVQGQVTFKGAGGLEQPLWNPEMGKFMVTVPGPTGGNPSIAIIDAKTMKIEKSYTFNCLALTGTASSSITGIALAPFQHLLVAACGQPVILSALTGNVINVITQVGGGDEVWFNPGDGRFLVTAANTGTPPVQQLGVIDAETSGWLQNIPAVQARNPAAFPENNHVFTLVAVTAPQVAGTTPDTSVCSTLGFKGTGCIAIFGHGDPDDK
ncbi:MAG TPA: hypothetical protein VNZ26_34235 [Vicinamibacterales bacterium]|nr:hypothetical protein [Vicinamibacterales bacterium]